MSPSFDAWRLRRCRHEGIELLQQLLHTARNGEVVASPGDFNGKDRLVQKPVTLKEQNTIEVELRSKPGSVLNVSITQPR